MVENRIVRCEDALLWMESQECAELRAGGASLVTSMPDKSEFPSFSLEDWQRWFLKSAELALNCISPEGVVFFYQSDIKFEGTWIDKSYLCQKAAANTGHQLLTHQIVCRAPAGTITYGRPSYSHLLCFSQKLRLHDLLQSTADVVPLGGEATWARGMGVQSCLAIARFIAERTETRTVINPFCGEGSMLAAANFVGLKAVGIERSAKRAEHSRTLALSQQGEFWVPDLSRAT